LPEDNLESVIKANEICNHYGMDTIAVGTVIAFAMGMLRERPDQPKEADGLSLTWGWQRSCRFDGEDRQA